MEELEKEMSKIGNNEEELVQELRTLRESKHKQEESTCERHVKRIDEDRVNLDIRVIDASDVGKYAHTRKCLEFVGRWVVMENENATQNEWSRRSSGGHDLRRRVSTHENTLICRV